jgi:hypothetical protein
MTTYAGVRALPLAPLAGAFAALLAPLAAHADPAPPAPPPIQGWQYEATAYGWLPWMTGDLGVTPAIDPVHVALSPGDVLKHLKFGLMGRFDARNNKWVGFTDLVYADVKFSDHITIRDRLFISGSVRSKMLISTSFAGYRVLDDPNTSVDLLAGVRLENIDDHLDLQGPRNSFSGGKSQFWADPLLGARFKHQLAPKWDATVWGDFGGFGAGSKFTGEVEGTVAYRFSSQWRGFAGWRYLYTDYNNNNGFVFNTDLNGPVLGATFQF